MAHKQGVKSLRIFQWRANHLTAIQGTSSSERRVHRFCTLHSFGIDPFVYPSAPKRQKDLADLSAKSLNHMVGAAGFELATLCSQSRCATRLRYAPNSTKYNLFLLSKRITRTFLHCTGKPILKPLPAHPCSTPQTKKPLHIMERLSIRREQRERLAYLWLMRRTTQSPKL